MENSTLAKSLTDLPDDTRQKYKLLSEKFEFTFKHKAEFFARAPGRVNLIGKKKYSKS